MIFKYAWGLYEPIRLPAGPLRTESGEELKLWSLMLSTLVPRLRVIMRKAQKFFLSSL